MQQHIQQHIQLPSKFSTHILYTLEVSFVLDIVNCEISKWKVFPNLGADWIYTYGNTYTSLVTDPFTSATFLRQELPMKCKWALMKYIKYCLPGFHKAGPFFPEAINILPVVNSNDWSNPQFKRTKNTLLYIHILSSATHPPFQEKLTEENAELLLRAVQL